MKTKQKNICWDLFITFLRIGGFTIGGGFVMLPLIQKEVVDNKKWISEDEIVDYFTVGQSLPGIIAINTCTMVGYKLKKVPGAVAATAGMITPSLIIITLIAAFLTHFQDIPLVQSAFNGIRAAVVATIAMAVVRMAKKSVVNRFGIFIAILSFTVVSFFDVSPIWVIIFSALVGILFTRRGGANK